MNTSKLSLLHHLSEGTKTILPSADVTYSPADSLSFIRGGNFFSSAIAYRNSKGLFALQARTHYERLVDSHKSIYSKRNLPISYTDFLADLTELLAEVDKVANAPIYQLTITFTGGQPQSYGAPPYSSGFGGRINKLLISASPLEPRPDWCYDRGVHLKTFVHQRLIPSAKVTSYLGGIRGQHAIDAINVATCLALQANPELETQTCLNLILNYYESLSEDEKDDFHEMTQDGLVGLTPSPDAMPRFPYDICFSTPLDRSVFDANFNQLFHETLFVSPRNPNEILEGSTFAILGIDSKGVLTVTESDDVLVSTNVLMIEAVAKKQGIPIQKKPLLLSELTSFQLVFMVSAKRILFDPKSTLIMPVAQIDNQPLSITQSETLTKLQEGISDFVEHYDYDADKGSLT